jgi:hypothetical protein
LTDRVPTALERLLSPDWSRYEHGNRLVIHDLTTRTFVRSPGFETAIQAQTWLFDNGCRNHVTVEKGPDGLYRGSGEVTGG